MHVKKETTKITITATITPAIPKYNPPEETDISFVRSFAVSTAGCVVTMLTTVELLWVELYDVIVVTHIPSVLIRCESVGDGVDEDGDGDGGGGGVIMVAAPYIIHNSTGEFVIHSLLIMFCSISILNDDISDSSNLKCINLLKEDNWIEIVVEFTPVKTI